MKTFILEPLQYLQRKWKLSNLLQVFAILCVFSLAGTSAVFLRPIFFEFIGLPANANLFIKVVCYIMFVFPVYQLMLLGYGWMFGQYRFFINKMKHVGAKLKKRR